ncbi:MAG: 50S ribosomal protein L4 [Patescibacteria group bacterium]|nr:50S ribosomal protein L4 [Patescibacteria group bacterium]
MKTEIKVVDASASEVGSKSWQFSQPTSGEAGFAQYLRVSKSRARKAQASVKTRGEVSGGGKKPWRQKGTGRARQGSTRSPLWRGGGVAHGPMTQSHRLKLARKFKRKIWAWVIGRKAKATASLFILSNTSEFKKTKDAENFLKRLLKERRLPVLLVSGSKETLRAFRNLSGIRICRPESLNPKLLAAAGVVILGEDSFEKIEGILKNEK